MSESDRRSVGELLHECDVTARRLLIDPDSLDSAAMVRVWPELVQAGHEFLAALPGPGTTRVPGLAGVHTPADPTGEHLHLMASALNDNLRARTWPGDGPADERLLALTGNLVRAHDLLVRGLRTSTPPSPAVQADAAAARTRVLHTLYVTAHGLSLAAGAESRALEADSRSMRRIASVHKLRALKQVLARLDTFEQVAGAEVYRSFPAALDGQQPATSAADRLRDAVARWEVETHRAMVADPSLGNIVELTRVQSATIALSHLLLQGAADAGVIDASAYRTGLAPRLTQAASAWSDLHSTVRDLTATGNRNVARDLRVAGSELVNALTELALDGTSIADPAKLIERVRSSDLPRTLVRALGTHPDASRILLDAALDPRTRVDARAAQRVITGLTKSECSSSQEPWVSPRDIAIGREVPLPAPIRGVLLRDIGVVERASVIMAAESAGLARTTLLAGSEAQTASEGGRAKLVQRAVFAPSASPPPVPR